MQIDSSVFIVATIFLLGLIGFAQGRVRHDIVALIMLICSIVAGVVSARDAFSGFADPVVITVAAIMVISAAVARSGVLEKALRPFERWFARETGITIVFSIFCGIASAFMNNVGALALILPAALAACRNHRVSPSRVLMPMAFASLLGGLTTMIGTPPNVIIAELRANYSSQPFSMFDFSAVGVPLALAGIIVALAFARMLPKRVSEEGDPLLFRVANYLFEVRVLDRTRAAPLTVAALENAEDEGDRLRVLAIDRSGILLAAPSPGRELMAGDIVQIEGRAPIVQRALNQHGLAIASDKEDDLLESALFECVVSDTSTLLREECAEAVLSSAGAALVAVSRNGRKSNDPLSKIRLRRGDVVLLQSALSRRAEIISKFHLLPLVERSLNLGLRRIDWIPLVALFGAVIAASTGLTALSVALVIAIVMLGLLGRLAGSAYEDIDWTVIVLLAALIPVAQAFADTGAGDLVARFLSTTSQGWPSWALIAIVLGGTMLVTPFLNNAAAVLIMGPIAVSAGISSGVSTDAMLMAVAVGASCDFLTPIGHQSNTLVWGPGGYRFIDYPRVGVPLTILILIAGTMLIERTWG